MTAKYDVYVKITDNPFDKYSFSFGDTKDASKYMGGFYKTIFKWVKCLLTVPGSDLSDRNNGTALAVAAGGVGGDLTSLQDMAILAISQATRKVQEYQAFESLPDEELLQGVRMVSFEQKQADIIHLTVELANIRNEKANLRLPLDVVDTRSSVE